MKPLKLEKMAKITFKIFNCKNGFWEDVNLSKIKFIDECVIIGGSFQILCDDEVIYEYKK